MEGDRLSVEVQVKDDIRYQGKSYIFDPLEGIIKAKFPFATIRFTPINEKALNVLLHPPSPEPPSTIYQEKLPPFPSLFEPTQFIKDGIPKIAKALRPVGWTPKISREQTIDALQKMVIQLADVDADDDEDFTAIVKQFNLRNKGEIEDAIEYFIEEEENNLNEHDHRVRMLGFMLKIHLSESINESLIALPSDPDYCPPLLKAVFSSYAKRDSERLSFDEFKRFFEACIRTANAEQCEKEPESIADIMNRAGEVWEKFTEQTQGQGFTLRPFQDLMLDTCRGPSVLSNPSLLLHFGVSESDWGRFLFEIAFSPMASEFLRFVFDLLKKEDENSFIGEGGLKSLAAAMQQHKEFDEEEDKETFEELKEKFAAVQKDNKDMQDVHTAISISDWYVWFLRESFGDPSSLKQTLKNFNTPLLL